ncbi:MAG: DNA-directed RNA polymerase subunit delta [Lactobacillaceae bacterium]|nr:DNA-directed RNA polymerase subunit delta [Lactobacillaceae bacterium]
MALAEFDGQNKVELSMIEVAREILHERQHQEMSFTDLVAEVQQFIGKTDTDIQDRLAQFYTDLNIDGSFISLGDNMWGLRSWYAIDQIDEAIHDGIEEEETARPKKKRKKVNAFLADAAADDDDVIDYNDDDPEDDDFEEEEVVEETAVVAATTDDDEDDDDDSDDEDATEADEFEVSTGIGDEIAGIKAVDDDYGSGDIEQ